MFKRLRKKRSPPVITDPIERIETPDVWVEFRSQAEWAAWSTAHPAAVSIKEAQAIVESVKALGIQSDFLGRVPADSVRMLGNNYREELLAAGFNPRQRVVLDRLVRLPGADDIWNFRIYGHEALTPFALALRGRYPLYLGSEYAADQETANRWFPIPAIDIARSGLPDEAFDLIVSNEVLEHVPDIDAAFRDSARILKTGGVLLATFPFASKSSKTRVRAVAAEDGIRHLEPAEYHGNPTDPERGSLVFQVPGWDVLAQAKAAGFRDAWMSFASSRRKGYTGGQVAGIFLFEATK
jgi:hypothetical protein